jgi:hypothetical protein
MKNSVCKKIVEHTIQFHDGSFESGRTVQRAIKPENKHIKPCETL